MIREWAYGRYKQLLTWIGDIMLATAPPKTKAEHILKMMSIIKPGDIICRKYTYYLDSYLIPGIYSHSGLVISNNKMHHSIIEGVSCIHPIDFIKDCDGFIILRPKYIDLGFALERSQWHIDNKTEYDITFKDKNKFYCHEFVCDCLWRGGVDVPMVIKEFGIFPFKFKRELYLAEQLIEKCHVMYEMV
jgi:hypothetical protein